MANENELKPANLAAAPSPNNPYNIDYARERRLKKMFIGFIVVAFILSAFLLFGAFLLDAALSKPQPTVPSTAPETQGTPATTSSEPVRTLLTVIVPPASGSRLHLFG